MLDFYELSVWDKYPVIAGLDEVGRGCIAGPIVGGCVIWDREFILNGLIESSTEYEFIKSIKDSKKILPKKRKMLTNWINDHALFSKTYEISAETIDQIGIQKANKEVLTKAVSLFDGKIDHILTDFLNIDEQLMKSGLPRCTPLLHGDSISLSIASASIIAKVYRDELMQTIYHEKYPEYGFNTNVGYGTKFHIDAVSRYGITNIHRRSFFSNIPLNPKHVTIRYNINNEVSAS